MDVVVSDFGANDGLDWILCVVRCKIVSLIN
jgi:hypothetical protein